MKRIRFHTKVLAPVIAVMVLVVTVSMWLATQRIQEQIRESADQQLKSAEAMLKITQQSSVNDLLRNYGNTKNEPRFKAATKLFDPKKPLDPDQRKTFLGYLNDLIDEGVADVIVLTPRQGFPIPAARKSSVSLDMFETNAAHAVSVAIAGQPEVDTVKNGGRLFDIVAIPIFIGNTNTIVGVITFGVENSLAQKFASLSQSELTLLSDGQVVTSTLRDPNLLNLMPAQFAMGNQSKQSFENEGTTLGDEHFLSLAGWLGEADDPHRLGYIILSSYEIPLRNLREARQMIFLASALAIAFGGAIVWFLVSRVTRPLRELRDSAEAVGRGDFTRRVRVRSGDECGELAVVFNQMTENLRQSRAQLEQTVTTLKNTQAQLIQSEKLSAIGEFVAGVTHELNNPLAAVMGFSEMLKDADVDVKHRRYLDMIYKSARRCQKIVHSLLSFARRHQPERKVVNVNTLIEAVLEIVTYQLRTGNIEVVTRLDSNLPLTLADPHQMQQVILNIINNARQAMESHRARGSIKIITEASDQNVRLIIHDSGPGIPEENLQRIFDPFFTTKEPGKGTGLGLSLCYGIVKEHGGTITPLNRPGEGATFIIELPILHISGDTTELSSREQPDDTNPREGAGKRVLAIDDEETILEVLREELTGCGYQVDTVADGQAALRLLKENQYDVIFCDWKMPGLNGRQVYEELRVAHPALCRRVVFITGDVINEPMRAFLEDEQRPCLAKPFMFDDVRNVIKTVLAAA